MTGLGDTLEEARARAYEACELISFAGRALPARHRGQGGERCRLSTRRETSPIGLLEELDEPGPLVGILVGSESDLEAMDPALAELRRARDLARAEGPLGTPRPARGRRVRVDGAAPRACA